MATRPLTTLRQAMTALVLLVVVLLGVEIWMRFRSMPQVDIVTCQAIASDQSLLAPSAVCHHDLRRMMNITHQADPDTSVSFRVNSMGCRGAEVDVPAPQGTYRILLLGDDTICGTAVPEEDTVAARLQQFLSKSTTTATIEVINGGVPGYCPLLASLKFDHDLAKLRPDLVILHVDMTDVSDDGCYRSLVLQEDGHAVCTHATLRLPSKSVNSFTQLVKQSATASWLFAKAREHGPGLLSLSDADASSELGISWMADNPPDLRLQIRHALKPIQHLQESVIRSGGQLLVTTSPLLWQVVSSDVAPELSRRCGVRGSTPYKSQFPFEVLANFCADSGIHFFDAAPAFRNDKAARLFSTNAPVLSRIGMALYAREIARSLLAYPPSKWSD